MTHFEFDSLVLSSSDFLHPYALSLTNNGEDAKDLYQETMLRALSNRDKYQWGTNLKGWLCIIMRNIFINQYRRNKRFTKVSSEAPTEVFQFDMGEIARNDGFSNVRMGEIQSAIAELPPVFRLCFEMHHAGYKYAEIADFLKEPLGTIKSRIHFARKALVKKLDR